MFTATYTYDLANRLTQSADNSGTRTYTYDTAGQLSNDNGTTWTYDATGNRTNTGYSTTTGNRITSDGTWTYTYDDEGNVTSKTDGTNTWTYQYDLHNQLVASISNPGSTAYYFGYDALGNRTYRSDATTGVEYFVYDGWDTTKPGAIGNENFDVVADLDSNGNVVTRRVYGAGFDDLVARIDSNGDTLWYNADRQGSVRQVFDNSGTSKASVDYDAFGGILSGVLVDRYGYTGREWDSDVKLQFNRERVYDPSTGRWMQEDPIGFAAGDANLYRYVGNGATNGTDPSGLFASGKVMDMLKERYPEIYLWFKESGASIRGIRGSWFLRRLEDTYFGKMENGKPQLYINFSLSDEDALAAIVNMTKSHWQDAEVGEHFRNWEHEKILKNDLRVNVANKVAEQLVPLAEVVVMGARIEIAILTTVSSGVAISEAIINIGNGDISGFDVATLLPVAGKLAAKGIKKVHVKNAKGEVRIVHVDDLLKSGKGVHGQEPKPHSQPEFIAKPETKRIDTPGSTQKPIPLPIAQTGRSCFIAGTQIITDSGYKAIENIVPGDLVLSRSELEPEGPIERKAVLQVFTRSSQTVRVVVSGHQIVTTSEHPFYVLGKGWKNVVELQIGDQLASHNLFVGIVEEFQELSKETVYNIRVDDTHTYFVGGATWDFSVWVHNAEQSYVAMLNPGDGKYYLYTVEKGTGYGGRDVEIPVKTPNGDPISFGNKVDADEFIKRNVPAPNSKLPRFEGPKPSYSVNPEHAPGTLRRGKTPLPADAHEVFRHAVPDDPVNPRHWYGRNADGQIYRFSGSNDGKAHFSGIDGVGDGIRNITKYARDRLEEML